MEGGFGGGRPYGLAAASQNTTDSHSECSLHRIGITHLQDTKPLGLPGGLKTGQVLLRRLLRQVQKTMNRRTCWRFGNEHI